MSVSLDFSSVKEIFRNDISALLENKGSKTVPGWRFTIIGHSEDKIYFDIEEKKEYNRFILRTNIF